MDGEVILYVVGVLSTGVFIAVAAVRGLRNYIATGKTYDEAMGNLKEKVETEHPDTKGCEWKEMK